MCAVCTHAYMHTYIHACMYEQLHIYTRVQVTNYVCIVVKTQMIINTVTNTLRMYVRTYRILRMQVK